MWAQRRSVLKFGDLKSHAAVTTAMENFWEEKVGIGFREGKPALTLPNVSGA